ncbi:MAG TPA: DUF1552 domain-containing protein [Polyangiaceae bacterium]|nr:DUF1552 domain-containing protein [Polyangiaceae bacterium]
MKSRRIQERLNRRQLLRGLGGLTLGLPLLRSVQAKAEVPSPPKRLVLMFAPNGVIPDAWWPQNARSETDFDLAACHQPLSPFKNRLTLFSGVDLRVAAEGPGGLHQRGIGGLFTGQQLQTGTAFVDGCGQTSGWADGMSVDQAVAQQIGKDTLLTSLELGLHATDNDVQGRISYAGPGQPLPPLNNPFDVYNRLFSMLGGGGDAVDALRANRRSVLDAVSAQFGALSQQVSKEDQQKLDLHLTLVRDVERRLTDLGGGACSAPTPPPSLDPTLVENMPQIADLELDLLAIALACDLTRVASFAISSSLNRIGYPWLGSTSEGHTLSHAGVSDESAKQQLVRRHTWHAERLAYLLTRLASYQEPDGTSVLDNTLVLWGSEVSLGYTHSHQNMPFLMVGGGWHFRTGRYLTYQNAPHSNLLVSVMNAMGVPVTTFGRPELCTGPLSNLT